LCRSAILCKACVKGEQGRSPTTTTLWPAQSASSGIFATAEPTGNRNQDQRGANGTGARAVWLRIRCADGNNQMAIWGRRCRSLRCYEARRTTAATLARSLSALPPDERGWITFTEARILFSSKGDQYAFGETDDDGRKNIESFAAQHQSVINFMPIEGRVYFVRDPTAVTSID